MSINQFGIQGYSGGAIADQTLLLQDIRDGLIAYNTTVDPTVDMLSELTTREVLRVSQGPKQFQRSADGGNPEDSRMLYRTLSTPLMDYDLSSEFTVKWLQDALTSDVINEVRGALAGDAELVNSLFHQAIFTKKTVGAIGTTYQAGFYNGETDVPGYKNSSFSSAHYHYLGASSTTYTLAVHRAMMIDIQEHGYGLTPGTLMARINTAQIADVMALINSNSTILQAITGQRAKAIDAGVVATGVTIEGCVVVVDDNVPASYVCMLATDVKPLSRRVHYNPAYQGLQIYRKGMVSDEYPLAGMQFLRRIGFAGQLLGAGTCRYLTGSATYTNPTWRLG